MKIFRFFFRIHDMMEALISLISCISRILLNEVQQPKRLAVRRNSICNFNHNSLLTFSRVVYFRSFDVNNDRIITRDDLEACLPSTVESQQLIQQLLRQWDVVSFFF